ncbi:MAG: lipid A deacylase LpxR family protein [Ferrovibrio sp.]|nr:lipid A deacylase LpxR family protein [Ferrovibrio sp.]
MSQSEPAVPRRLIAHTLLLTLLAAPVLAQEAAKPAPVPEPPPPQKAGTLSFVLENDMLFANSDRHYTNGVHMSWLTAPGAEPEWIGNAARMLPIFSDTKDLRVELALGQSMYTPRDISQVNPPSTDRPYAGWLYGTVGVISETRSHLDQLQLGIGIVGPASFAEQSQKIVHEAIGSREPMGWDSQLKSEPTLQLNYQRSWRYVAAPDFLGLKLDATPHAGVALGNAFTYANTGMMLRLGYNTPKDYGPPRVQPSLPGSGYFEPVGDFGFYFFAGFEGRAVARNMFLDGNLFTDSRSVSKRPLVGDVQAGVAVIWQGMRFAYTHTMRSQEFDGQDQPDRFGAFSVSFRF